MTALPDPVWIAGCGFIGHALALRLHEAETTVIGLTHSEASADRLRRSSPFQVEAADIADPMAVAALGDRLPTPAAIVHCASSGRGGAESYRAVYLEGCRNLHATCPSAHLVFTSSTSVYPQTEGESVTEESPAEPGRETGQILRQAEEIVLAAHGTVLRLSGIYGPGRSVLLQRFLDGSARIESGTSRFLNQIHRDDAVRAILTVLANSSRARGEIFNVCDGDPLTQRQCYEGLARLFDTPTPPEAPPDLNRKRGWTHKRVIPAKLHALGWQTRHSSFLDAARNDTEFVESIRRQVANPGSDA